MAMKQFARFTARDVIVIAGTVPLDSGRGEDEFVNITKSEDEVTYHAGVDGDGVTSSNHNSYHEVVVTMMATSKGNAALTQIHKLGKTNSKGFVVIPLSIMDKGSLGDLFVAAEAWIMKFPDQAYAKKSGVIQWKFGVHDPERAIMGH